MKEKGAEEEQRVEEEGVEGGDTERSRGRREKWRVRVERQGGVEGGRGRGRGRGRSGERGKRSGEGMETGEHDSSMLMNSAMILHIHVRSHSALS